MPSSLSVLIRWRFTMLSPTWYKYTRKRWAKVWNGIYSRILLAHKCTRVPQHNSNIFGLCLVHVCKIFHHLHFSCEMISQSNAHTQIMNIISHWYLCIKLQELPAFHFYFGQMALFSVFFFLFFSFGLFRRCQWNVLHFTTDYLLAGHAKKCCDYFVFNFKAIQFSIDCWIWCGGTSYCGLLVRWFGN